MTRIQSTASRNKFKRVIVQFYVKTMAFCQHFIRTPRIQPLEVVLLSFSYCFTYLLGVLWTASLPCISLSLSLCSVVKENGKVEAKRNQLRWLSNSVFSLLNLQSCVLLLSHRSPASDLPSSSWPQPLALALSECFFLQFLGFSKDSRIHICGIINGSLYSFLLQSCLWIWVFVCSF